MTNSRETFLQRVREAVRAGNRPGSAAPVEPRGQVGYQGGGPDPVARFGGEFVAAGGQLYLVPDRAGASAKLLELVRASSARRVLLGRGALLDALNLREPLQTLGVEVVRVDPQTAANSRAAFFDAEVGISGVDYLVAETGTMVLLARAEEPRSLSLLPPVHIAVADRSQLVPDLFDLIEVLGPSETGGLPSCVSLITGPSKTGDIELRLVTGVHGPGEIHLVLIVGA